MNTSAATPPAIVAGTGFGSRVHVPALRAAGFNVVGLVGTDAARTQARAAACGVAHGFGDLDEAITRTGATLVSIATPPHTHGPLALAAIARGCHVLCEKPFASDLAEARAMHAAAEHAGVVHLVAHEFRWQPEHALLTRAIADQLIGAPRLLTLTSYLSQLASPHAKMPDWWFDRSAGGGWLGAHGTHIIDQIRSGFGEFATLSATLPMVSEREDVAEDSYALNFTLVNGISGVAQHTAGAWGPSAFMTRIAGTRGTLWLADGAVQLADRNGTRTLTMPPDLKLPVAPPDGDPNSAMWYLLAPFIRLCEFMRAAVEGKLLAGVSAPTFADGVAGMEVLDAARASAAAGGTLISLR